MFTGVACDISFKHDQYDNQDETVFDLRPVTHAPETGDIGRNIRCQVLAPVFPDVARFLRWLSAFGPSRYDL